MNGCSWFTKVQEKSLKEKQTVRIRSYGQGFNNKKGRRTKGFNNKKGRRTKAQTGPKTGDRIALSRGNHPTFFYFEIRYPMGAIFIWLETKNIASSPRRVDSVFLIMPQPRERASLSPSPLPGNETQTYANQWIRHTPPWNQKKSMPQATF